MTVPKAIVDDAGIQTQPSLYLDRGRCIIKRTADLVIAVFLLVFTAPLMLLVAMQFGAIVPARFCISKSGLAIVVGISKL